MDSVENRNSVILLILRLVRHLMSLYIDVFVSMYFISLSDGSYVELILYRIIMYISVIVMFYLTGRVSKSDKRLWLVRIGLFFYVMLFVSIVLLKEYLTEYWALVGLLQGTASGSYYSCINVLEAEGVSDGKSRLRFLGSYQILKGILGIVFSIMMGNLLHLKNFSVGSCVVLLLSMISCVLILFYKDTKHENIGKFDMLKAFRKIWHNGLVKKISCMNICAGMTYSDGAFNMIATVFILKVFHTSLSAGWVTAINCFVSCVVGYLLSRVLNSVLRIKCTAIFITGFICMIVVLMVINSNLFILIAYYFAYNMYKDATDNISNTLTNTVVNNSDWLKSNKTEYFIINDTFLFIGRFVSYSIFLVYALSLNSFILLVFLIPIVTSYTLQNVLLKDLRNTIIK